MTGPIDETARCRKELWRRVAVQASLAISPIFHSGSLFTRSRGGGGVSVHTNAFRSKLRRAVVDCSLALHCLECISTADFSMSDGRESFSVDSGVWPRVYSFALGLRTSIYTSSMYASQ